MEKDNQLLYHGMIRYIDVSIPYEPRKKLDVAYNRIVCNSKADWVLLLDHDVYLCNPYWYLICLKAVNTLNETKAGLITCVTNGVHNANRTPQKADIIDKSSNIAGHTAVAEELYRKYGDKITEVNWSHITGFFMLVRRQVAVEIGFRRGESGKIDWNFGIDLKEAGYDIYLLPGLYVFHNRGITKKNNYWKNLEIANYEVM